MNNLIRNLSCSRKLDANDDVYKIKIVKGIVEKVVEAEDSEKNQ